LEGGGKKTKERTHLCREDTCAARGAGRSSLLSMGLFRVHGRQRVDVQKETAVSKKFDFLEE